MEAGDHETIQLREVEKIERETGVRVPNFVSRWPIIAEEKAADLALTMNLVDTVWLKEKYGNLDHERVRSLAAKTGLLYCRNHNLCIDEALAVSAVEKRQELNALDLFERFLKPDWDKGQLVVSEARRREQRDKDILYLETDLLGKRGIIVPPLPDLLRYCEWILETRQVNKRYEDWGDSFRQTPEMVYWDLMKHYSQIIQGAKESFNPLVGFQVVIEGEVDVGYRHMWHLQNLGKEDITYYSMSEAWGGGARTKSGEVTFPELLLTHTTSVDSAVSIVEGSYLDPRVCLSAGRVVAHGIRLEVTYLFNRDELMRTYSVRKLTEAGHEKELRSEEPVHVGFAIGCVPTSRTLFPDFIKYSQGTEAIGETTIRKWEDNYRKTGKLWSDEEIERIRRLAREHHREDK